MCEDCGVAKKHRLLRRHFTRGLNIPSGLLKSFPLPLTPDHEACLEMLVDGRDAAGCGVGRRPAPPPRRHAIVQGDKPKIRRARNRSFPIGNSCERPPRSRPDFYAGPLEFL